MKYPRFRLKIILTLVIAETIGIMIKKPFRNTLSVYCMAWPNFGLIAGGFPIVNLITHLNRLETLLTFREAGSLLQQLSTGALYGFIINITNIILTKPRTILKIYYFDIEHN